MSQLINQQHYFEFAGELDAETLTMLRDLFLQENGEYCDRIADLTKLGALKEIGAIMHSLKSSAATFGCSTLAERSADLEMRAKADDESILGEMDDFLQLARATFDAFANLPAAA
ncbi:MAG: Hpt domain-containing protein [Pseudomonadota bacterium]